MKKNLPQKQSFYCGLEKLRMFTPNDLIIQDQKSQTHLATIFSHDLSLKVIAR